MTKNQTPKTANMPTLDGRQVMIQDGSKWSSGQIRWPTDGCASIPQQDNQIPGCGRQTSAQTTSQGTFVPVSGPKIPPMEK